MDYVSAAGCPARKNITGLANQQIRTVSNQAVV